MYEITYFDLIIQLLTLANNCEVRISSTNALVYKLWGEKTKQWFSGQVGLYKLLKIWYDQGIDMIKE